MGWGCSLQLPGISLSVFPIQEIWPSEQHFSFAVYNTSVCSLIFLKSYVWFLFKDCYMDDRTFIGSFSEGAEPFSGCLEAHTRCAVQFTSLRGRGSFLPTVI